MDDLKKKIKELEDAGITIDEDMTAEEKTELIAALDGIMVEFEELTPSLELFLGLAKDIHFETEPMIEKPYKENSPEDALYSVFQMLEKEKFAFLTDNTDPYDFGERVNTLLTKHSLKTIEEAVFENIENALEEDDEDGFVTWTEFSKLTKERGLSLFLMSPQEGFWSEFAVLGIKSEREEIWKNKIIGNYKLELLVEEEPL